MATKGRSKHAKDKYAAYKAAQRWKTNRTRKLEAAIKASPNNLQLVEALKGISYRRSTPNKKVWSSVTRNFAQLVKSVEGRFNPLMLHPNDDIRRTNMLLRPKNFVKATKFEGSMFSIKARLAAKGVTWSTT